MVSIPIDQAPEEWIDKMYAAPLGMSTMSDTPFGDSIRQVKLSKVILAGNVKFVGNLAIRENDVEPLLQALRHVFPEKFVQNKE